jgi:hypothetical protein
MPFLRAAGAENSQRLTHDLFNGRAEIEGPEWILKTHLHAASL